MAGFLSELKRRNVVRAAAAYVAVSWLLVQVAETVLPLFGFGDAVARAVVIILAVGFIPALVFSWVFDVTPEGLMRDADIARDAPRSASVNRNLNGIIIVGLTLAVAFFALDKFMFDPARDAALREQAKEEGRKEALISSFGDRSIAVLPFDNLSSDPEQEFFSDGISEEILNLLARIPELRVISRSSSFAFKDQDVSLTEIAERLHVAHVLEGSVRKSGNTIRVTAQLIDARTDAHIWSDTWDRDLNDVFEIQDDIAADVVQNLKLTLIGPIPTASRTDPQTHALTLRARALQQIGHSGASEQARQLLLEAVERDPEYVPAMLDLALATYGAVNLRTLTPDEAGATVGELLSRAKALDPDNPRVQTYMAWASFEAGADPAAVAAEFLGALRRAPNDTGVLNPAAEFAARLGRFDTAITLRERALELDPLCFSCIYNLARIYRRAGRYDEALEYHLQYMESSKGGDYTLGVLHLLRGHADTALEVFESGRLNDFNVSAGRAMALYDLDRTDEAEAALQAQLGSFGDEYPVPLAAAYAWINRTDEAFAWIEKSIESGRDSFEYFLHDPLFVGLHGDPRWLELKRQAGFDDNALAAIEFDPRLPD
jgi:TolB-like protein/Tfp pilus assembly protein PilF